jgi:nucleotide-binding universal stress UspA family protein
MRERRPLGNVLVATDFSVAATRAVERAAQLPISPGSALTVLHVLRPGCRPEGRADAKHALGHAVSVAVDAAAHVGRKDVDVFPHLVEGTPFVEIIRGARHGRNELIVAGRHGERTFRELLLGSTAERVIRKGDTSILVVGARIGVSYKRPLVAIDCSDTSRRAVELAWRLVDPGVQALGVVYAYEPIPESAIRRAGFSSEDALQYRLEARREAQSAVETFLAAGDGAPPANVIVREGDARPEILDVAWRRDADLLALGTHGRSGVAHLLLGSVAEAVIRGASCDVLVARAVGLPFKLP